MTKKIIWSEGMALSPHHFQQSDMAEKLDHQFKWNSLNPNFYGFKKIRLNPDALETGSVSLSECSGIFRDGTVFSCGGESEQMTRSFEDFLDPGVSALDVYLTIPEFKKSGVNLAGKSGNPSRARFFPITKEVFDLNNGENPRNVRVAGLNLRLHFAGEHLDGLQKLKLGSLQRNERGAMEFNSKLIPAILQTGASNYLMAELKSLLEVISAKRRHLMAGRSRQSSGALQFRPDFFNNYLMLMALNQFLPRLNYYYCNPHIHPEILFTAMIEFCGSLTSFGSDEVVVENFKYDQLNLSSTFSQLFRGVKTLLEHSHSRDFYVAEARQSGTQKYTLELKDKSYQKYFLAVSGGAEEHELVQIVENNLKAGPGDQIDQMVSAAAAGVSLKMESTPPANVPVKPGYKYFRLDTASPLFTRALEANELSIHIPSRIRGMKLELVAMGEA